MDSTNYNTEGRNYYTDYIISELCSYGPLERQWVYEITERDYDEAGIMNHSTTTTYIVPDCEPWEAFPMLAEVCAQCERTEDREKTPLTGMNEQDKLLSAVLKRAMELSGIELWGCDGICEDLAGDIRTALREKGLELRILHAKNSKI